MTVLAQEMPHPVHGSGSSHSSLALRTRIFFGAGAIARLGQLAAQVGGRRVLVVTDPGIVQAGHVERAEDCLTAAGFTVARFEGVGENPTTRTVEACVSVAREYRADLLVGLGGGSSIDTAKGCNFLLTNGGRMEDYWGRGKAERPMLPLIAVPTTAGTGSECQSFALISQETTHAKMACGDPKAAPRVALLDPELTLTQPPAVAAATGIDALAHAIESAVTTARTPFSQVFSHEAFRRCARSLPKVLECPDDLDARGDMLLGAALAGLAIEHSMLGAAHSAANPLTARFGLTHGQAVGMMLPAVVRFNAQSPGARSLYRELIEEIGSIHGSRLTASRRRARGPAPALDADARASSLRLNEPSAADPAEASYALACFLEELLESAGMARSLAELGIHDPPLDSLAEEAAAQWTARFNPRPVAADDFTDLYRRVLGPHLTRGLR